MNSDVRINRENANTTFYRKVVTPGVTRNQRGIDLPNELLGKRKRKRPK